MGKEEGVEFRQDQKRFREVLSTYFINFLKFPLPFGSCYPNSCPRPVFCFPFPEMSLIGGRLFQFKCVGMGKVLIWGRVRTKAQVDEGQKSRRGKN